MECGMSVCLVGKDMKQNCEFVRLWVLCVYISGAGADGGNAKGRGHCVYFG